MIATRPTSLATLVLALVGCAGEAGSAPEAELVSIDVTDVGLSTPESVLHDPVEDVYLVSNISGAPLDKDGDGFISRLSPDGEVIDLKWIDGASGAFELNGPKGMAIRGDQLFVADIDCVRIFGRVTGAPEGDVCFPGASFLNDVAVDGNDVLYVTDTGVGPDFGPTGTDAVYRFSEDGRMAKLAEGAALGAPNGIAFGPRGGFVVSFGSGEVYQLGPSGREEATILSAPQLDGIVFTPAGGFLFSSWGESAIYHVTSAGVPTRVVEGADAPADIGYDAQRNRVLIPLFNSDAVWIREIEPEGAGS